MHKFSVRKVLSVLIFILFIGFIVFLIKNSELDLYKRDTFLILGGLLISGILLFIMTITNPVKILKEMHTDLNTERKENNEDEKEADTEMTKETVLKLLNGLDKQKDIHAYTNSLLSNFAATFYIVQGLFYIKQKGTSTFKSVASYAFYTEKETIEFTEGEGLNGQTALDKKTTLITDLAEGYINVVSGLGSSSPNNLLIIPFVYNNETIALAELASFEEYPTHIKELIKEINKPVSETIFKLL